MERDKVDGTIQHIQYFRLQLNVDIMRRFDWFKGWPQTYEESKDLFKQIPKAKRWLQYVTASRVVVLFPQDSTEKEVLHALELLVSDLRKRWKPETT